MKKLLSLLCCVLLLALSACSAEDVQPSQVPAEKESQSSASGAKMQVKLLESMYGLQNTASTENGTFVWDMRPDNGSNITYIDYNTQSQIYLCNQPSCKHNSENCTSWFSCFGGYLFLSPDEQTLYCVEVATPTGSPVDKIWAMSQNGADRKVVLSLASGESFIDTVAGSGDLLYLSVTVPNNPKELREVNMVTGESTVLCQLPPRSWVFGAFEDKLVLLHLKSSKFIYETLSLSTKETTVFYEYPYENSGKSPVARCDGDTLYIVEPIENNLARVIKRGIQTGEETVLTTQLPFYHVDTTFIKGFYDDHILLTVTDNSDANNIRTMLYGVSCTDGTVTELQHMIRFGLLNDPTSIVAQTPTDFLILGDYIDEVVSLTSNDGTMYESEIQMSSYQFIAKADFWNNQKNYRKVPFPSMK